MARRICTQLARTHELTFSRITRLACTTHSLAREMEANVIRAANDKRTARWRLTCSRSCQVHTPVWRKAVAELRHNRLPSLHHRLGNGMRSECMYANHIHAPHDSH